MTVASIATAQQNFPSVLNPVTESPSTVQTTKIPEKRLSPVPTGVFYMMSQDGLEVINPFAATSLGTGEFEFKEPIIPISRLTADPLKSSGGICLFGLDF